MKKRILAILIAAVMLLGLVPVALADDVSTEETKDIVVLYTNDTHCGVTDGMGFAGVARVKAALEAAGYPVVLVDNGDAVQGDVIGTLSKGEAIIELMNTAGYEFAAIGNHWLLEHPMRMQVRCHNNTTEANLKLIAKQKEVLGVK